MFSLFYSVQLNNSMRSYYKISFLHNTYFWWRSQTRLPLLTLWTPPYFLLTVNAESLYQSETKYSVRIDDGCFALILPFRWELFFQISIVMRGINPLSACDGWQFHETLPIASVRIIVTDHDILLDYLSPSTVSQFIQPISTGQYFQDLIPKIVHRVCTLLCFFRARTTFVICRNKRCQRRTRRQPLIRIKKEINHFLSRCWLSQSVPIASFLDSHLLNSATTAFHRAFDLRTRFRLTRIGYCAHIT